MRMGDSRTEYTLIDSDDGEETKVVFIHRSCGCMSPGCVDDEIQFYEGGDEHPYRLTVPRVISPYIEGLFYGALVVKSQKIND